MKTLQKLQKYLNCEYRHHKLMQPIQIRKLVEKTGVKFGTSGIRALVTELTDEVCYLYTLAFLNFLKK
ncbi:MAG: hypothetical protein AABW52_04230 [Nanoarchaeota archaeon]